MKKLEKDFLLAWLMGMVLPSLILGVIWGLSMAGGGTAADETTVLTSMQYMPLAPQMTISVLIADGGMVNMELENYICGVVLAEMPADFELEALKAQSVVARTYSLRRLERGTKHMEGAVCTDPACCQGYISPESFLQMGGSQEGVEKVSHAVYTTAGEVVLYNGALIDATYFSCSGGMTEDAVAVWGSDVPYLQSTVSPGEENATHYSDSQSLSIDSVEAVLGVTLAGDPDAWFRILSYTAGGGVNEIAVCGEIYTGVQFRKLLNLRSTNFTVSVSENEIVFYTRGYGHRVGMSQYGADAMAVNGSTYDEILLHYYAGTTLGRYDRAIDKQEKSE